MQVYENILNDFVSFCETKEYKNSGIDKLYEKEGYTTETNIILVLARVALYNHVPLLVELYSTKSIGLYFNLFDCDPISASLLTKGFLEKEVDIISGFVEMKDSNGNLKNLLLGEEAVEQYAKEKKNSLETTTPTLLN